jgi:hypothetical protein
MLTEQRHREPSLGLSHDDGYRKPMSLTVGILRRAWPIGLLSALVCLAGCGGDASGTIAAKVGATTISGAAVAHWMSVIDAAASTAPGQPPFKPPVPPGYVACIAYLRAWAPWAKPVGGRPAPTSRRLKAQCEYEYEKLKLKALYFLISSVWLTGEAAELGVRVTDAQWRARLAVLKSQFPNEAAFRLYFVKIGLTIADLLAEIKQNVFAELIQRKLEKENDRRHLTTAQRQRVLNRFGSQFKAKWRSRTDCRPEYLVPICRQYNLPKVPFGLVPPAVLLTNMAAE